MPREIVKPDRDVDFYVEWSSVVEAPVGFGDREWMLNHLRVNGSTEMNPAADRLDRADRTGSSALGAWGWTYDDPTAIYQQQGSLPRTRLRELCDRLAVDENADATDLLIPFDDDEPAVGPGGAAPKETPDAD